MIANVEYGVDYLSTELEVWAQFSGEWLAVWVNQETFIPSLHTTMYHKSLDGYVCDYYVSCSLLNSTILCGVSECVVCVCVWKVRLTTIMFYVHMLLKAFELYNFVCVSECVLCGVCVCVCVCVCVKG